VSGRCTFWPVSVCVCVYICVCVYVYIYIKISMDLPLWARSCSECLVRGSCNHFAVTADKVPCVVDGHAGLSVCMCVYICIYIYVCVYMYIYVEKIGWNFRCGRASAANFSCVLVAIIST
jgi:hypothetical protein